jgi:hypothetical protein
VGASTSHNPMGLHGLLQTQLYFFIFFVTISTTCHTSVHIPNFGFCTHAYAFRAQRVSLRDYTPVESGAQSFYLMAINVRGFAGKVLSMNVSTKCLTNLHDAWTPFHDHRKNINSEAR